MLAQLFVVASAAALVSAQAPAPATSGCTSNSFTIPSWLVQNFESVTGKVSFHLVNRATNATTNLACAVSGTGWSACSAEGKPDLQASVQVNGATAQVKVNETWTCNDRPGAERLKFSGSASSAIALSCAADKPCVSANPQVLLKATLTSPVAVTPAYLEGPTGHDLAGCKATSQNPSWTVTTAYFVDQSGDGISAMPTTSISLIFSNNANQYQVSCMTGDLGGEGQVPAGKLMPLTCAGYEFQSFTTGRYSLSTAATFDPATLTLSLNQTWYCDDTDPGRPVMIKAEANQVLPLTCSTSIVYGFTRRTCEGDKDLTFKGKLSSEDSLTPFSVTDPLPTADGCTISSIFSPKWTISAFALDGKDGAATASTGTVNFNIILATGSRGFQYPIAISQGAPVAGNAGWYQCEVGPDGGIGQPLWPYSCSLKYNAATKELTLKTDWMCTDLDKEKPVLFSGITTTTVDSSLACETADGLSRCQTADPFFSWNADIANVTWKAGP